tara:strand:+ start:28262 stop:31006 length:2745 start_codon:yes stop_codon:yes gene_type:complete
MIQYILESIAFQLLFLIIYDVYLKQETFFQWNRVYLIGTYLLSLIVPLIKLEVLKTTVPKTFAVYPEYLWNSNTTTDIEMVVTTTVEQSFLMPWKSLILFGGMLVALLIFGFKLYQINRLRQKGEIRYLTNFTRVIIENSEVAFSFFKSIFLGDKVVAQEHESIIQHELVHIRQGHSYDLVFFEILRIVNWFNPLVYIYQSRISELHEFIADAQVAKTHKKEQYQLLLSQVFQTQHISFINPFFKTSLIKKRIVMLQKSKSKKIFQLKYLVLVPLVFGMLIYTSAAPESSLDTVGITQDEDDAALIKKVKVEIDKEVFEFGSMHKAMKSFNNMTKNENPEVILTKEDFFKSEIYLLRYLGFMMNEKIEEDETVVKLSTAIPPPSTQRYNEYIIYKQAFLILDDNLKISISAYSYDVILLDSENDYPKKYTLVKVKNVKDLTEDEIRNLNGIISDISKNSKLESIVLTDGTYSFKIYQKKYISIEEFEAREVQEIINRKGSTITFQVDDVQHLTAEEKATQKELIEEVLNSDTYDTLVITDGKMKTIIGGRTVPNDEATISKAQEFIDVPFSTVDEVPVFPGCENATDKRACFQEKMSEHISKNFRYPAEAQEKGIQGKVNLMFVIDESGTIGNLRMRGPSKILENEASRIISLLPKMQPGKEKGKVVRVPFSIPITFKLQGIQKEDKEEYSIEDQDLAIPFVVVDKVPVFPGCEDAQDQRACFREKMNEHISKNFRYPEEAQKQRIQGKVNTMFIIGKDGVIGNIRKRGPSKLLEDEAERIISVLPRMTPGVYKGKAVTVPFSIPIAFKLHDSQLNSEQAIPKKEVEAMFVEAYKKRENDKTLLVGKVSDGLRGLPGVNIVIKDSAKGVVTDFDGAFSIEVNEGQVITFQYVGLKTAELSIMDKEEYSIKTNKH